MGGFRFIVDRILSYGSSTRMKTEIQRLFIVPKRIILIIYVETKKDLCNSPFWCYVSNMEVQEVNQSVTGKVRKK